MSTTTLFSPIVLGNIPLLNHIVMAPMTRSRATANKIPSEVMIEYYKQRSSAGLIITEGTSPSINGDGYARTPGIYNESQINAWRKITHAVHHEGGKIFLQLMHTGRIGHPLNKALNAEIVAPSAIKAQGKIFTDVAGAQDFQNPRALRTDEIQTVVEEFRQASINAFESGFDGVELHAASGYLPMQFLSSNTNLRNDQYGGSVNNRIRFVIEVLEAMISVKGSEKIGIRIWPGSTFNDIHDENPLKTYTELLKAINPFNLAYVHSIRSPNPTIDIFKLVRRYFKGISIINGGLDLTSGEEAISSGLADLVSYGSLFISNPDLVKRFQIVAPLNSPDDTTFYTPGAKGYIDYPTLR